MVDQAGVSADTVRRTNLSRLLRLLHVEGALTRAELTASLGLNRSTVGTLVADLVARGLVHEGLPQATGGPGRPSPLVSIRTDTYAVLAIDVKVDSLATALIALGGHVLHRERMERPRDRTGVEETLDDTVELARRTLGDLAPGHTLLGVGLSVAGLVHRDSGNVDVAPNLGWQDVSMVERIAADLGLDVPTRAINDADAGVLAERLRGTGRGIDHLLYLSGEVGVGGGVIVDGQLMTGQDGYAGEVGHMVVDADGLACQCGATGCWETRVGEAALLRLAGESEDGGREAVDRVLAARASGDEAAVGAVTELGWWMGVGVTNLVNAFNPRRVVLGDLHARLHPHVVDQIAAQLRNASLVAARSDVDVVPSELGEDAALVGVAEALFADLLADPMHDRVTAGDRATQMT